MRNEHATHCCRSLRTHAPKLKFAKYLGLQNLHCELRSAVWVYKEQHEQLAFNLSSKLSSSLCCYHRSVLQRVFSGVGVTAAPIQFTRHPPRFRGTRAMMVGKDAPIMRVEVATLLAKGAIEPVPPAEMKSGFYSPYFVVPKKTDWLRPILDLCALNRALH